MVSLLEARVVLDRRTGLLIGTVAAVGAYVLPSVLVPAEIEFTRPGPAALTGIEARPAVSTAHVTLPLDLRRVTMKAEAALSQRLAIGLDAGDGACNRRPSTAECAGARLDASVAAGGNAEASASGNVVRVRIPLRVEAGQGTERQSLETAVSFAFKVQAGGGLPVEVARVDERGVELQPGPAGRAMRQLEMRLRPLGLTIQDELRGVLTELPVAMATERAWQALSQPIDLGGGAWLRAVPEVAGIADVSAVEGGFRLRVPIASRLSVGSGEATSSAQRRAVVHGQVGTSGSAVVRVSSPISLAPLQPALDAAFVNGGSIETKPDRFGPAVKVDVRRVRLYPSLRQLGLELDLAAARFEGQVYRGKAHLLGRPVLDAEARIVTLADISLSPVPQRDSTNVRQAGSAPRLANEPFAGKLAGAFRIDVARETTETLPRVNAILQRNIDDRLSLSARLMDASAAGFEVTRDGGVLLVDLRGSLSLHYKGAEASPVVATAASRAADPVAAGARTLGSPEIGAAVVAAATVTSAHSSRGSSPGIATGAGASGGIPAAAVSGSTTQDAAATGDLAPAPRTSVPRAQATKMPVPKSTKNQPSRQASAGNKASWVPFPTNN